MSGKEQSFTGTIDTAGTQVTGVIWTSGVNSAHSGGVTVVDYVAAAHIQLISKGMLVEHDQDGTHSAITGTSADFTGAVSADTISEHTAANGVTIDGLNIKDSKLNTNNSVVSSNITADAVTDAKLIYGKVRSRQGGSATNWITSGTTTYDYSGTDVFVQVGTIAITSNPQTITFPTAFNQVPIVIGSVNSGASFNCFVRFASHSATTVTASVYDDTGTTRTTETICWMAIGQ